MDDDEQFALGQQLPPPDINSIIFEGPLKKKSPKALALIPWQDRFVRLTKDALFYYKKKDNSLTSYQGAIPLSCVAKIIAEPPASKRKYRIDILLQEQYNRQFSFVAKSDAEMIQWHAVLEQTLATCREAQESKPTINAAMPTPGAAPGKIWKNVKEKEKKPDGKSKDDATSQKLSAGTVAAQYEQQQRQLVDRYIQLSKPIYPLMVPPARVNMFESLKVLAQCLFGGYRIEVQEQSLDLGSIFILGDTHYPMTHKSYLMHCAFTNNQFYGQALASMELLHLCSDSFPLFPRQIHCGQTKDAVYSIYHPPLRSGHDSLFAWLPKIEKFPEQVVAWIAAHVILTLDFIHNFHKTHVDPTLQGSQWANHPPVQFPTLSPETIFFDSNGQVRVCDLFLNPNPSLVSGIPEYLCPEVLCYDQQSTTASDYWRLGVLLYELATGLPPLRPDESAEDPQLDYEEAVNKYRSEIKFQLMQYQQDPNVIQFPDYVSPDLKSLITSLLVCNPEERLTDQSVIRQHPFFVTQAKKIHESIVEAYIDECGEQVAQEHPIPAIELWDVFGLINSPKLPWIHRNIIQELAKDPNTPPNLTFGAKPVPVQRLNISVKRIRGLMSSWARVAMPKMQLHVSVEGDTQRGTQACQCEKNSDVGLFNESMVFDLMHGDDLSLSSEIVIEINTLITSTVGFGAQAQTKQTPKQVGLVTFPLYEVRNLGSVNAWLMIYDHTGLPIGELEVDFVWEHEDIDLSPQTLGELTDASKLFQEIFAKPSPLPPRKLWASICDISTLAQFESGAIGSDDKPIEKNQQTMMLSSQAQNPLTMRGTFAQQQSDSRNTLVLGRETIASSNLQHIYQPPASGSGGSGLHPSFTPSSMQQNKSHLGASNAQIQNSPVLMPMSPLPSSQVSSQSRLGNLNGSPGSFGGLGSPVMGSPSSQFFQSGSIDHTNPAPVPVLPPVPSTMDSMHGSSLSSQNPSSGSLSQNNSGFGRPISHSSSGFTMSSNPPPLSMTHSYAGGPHTPTLDSYSMSSSFTPLGAAPMSSPMPQSSLATVPDLPPMVPDLPPELPPVPDVPPVPDLPPVPAPVPVPVAAPVAVDPNTVPKNWRRAKAPDGSDYFYNKVTKLTQWEPPQCLLLPAE